MIKASKNSVFRVKTDGFHGELFLPVRNKYPGKVLICFSGSDGRFEWSRMLAEVFQAHGLTALALAYVMEEDLPNCFYHVPIDPLETAAKRLHKMGYEKVGLWGISKGAELALTAGSLLPGLVNAVVAVAPMNTACQGFSKDKGMSIMPGSSWSFHGEEVPYTSFGVEKFPFWEVIRKSLKARELTMYDLYLPLVNTPSEQKLTKEDAVSFLEENVSWSDFAARFGAPNVTAYSDPRDWNIYYYELPDEDGEARWIRLLVEDGSITSAVLMGRSYHANGVLWKKED